MVRKMDAAGVKDKIDWEAVRLATEIPRTFLIRTSDGREFFKMYKPSEAHTIFEKRKWTGKVVSILDRKH